MSAGPEVTLVSMPFAPALSPSLGLSLLKPQLEARGIRCSVLYPALSFAERLGRVFYDALSVDGALSVEDLAGDWVFSRELFGPRAADEDYVDRVLLKRSRWTTNAAEAPASASLIRRLRRARADAGAFLDACLEQVLAARPRLLGFTSGFQQHVASLALARLVKRADPGITVVLGGPNCEGVMGAETVRRFRFVDAVVSGEADLVFPELAERLLEDRAPSGLPGVKTRQTVAEEFASGRFGSTPRVSDLDALPYPDFTDYFAALEASRFGVQWHPYLPFETSRGCWWGQRGRCSFCGVNGERVAYRSKSPPRALAELAFLERRHPGCELGATDAVLDTRYFEELLPQLAARRRGASLVYEVRSSLTKDQLRVLRAAGIRRIQPGIESFSDPVLRLMRKGVSALQNVQLLKWCKELGVEPSWNLLWGFPGEPPEEYARMAGLVAQIPHLKPPDEDGMIRLDRFSLHFDEAERLGFAEVEPVPPYRHVYALPAEAVANLACFFTFRYRERRDVSAYVGSLERAVRAWRRHASVSDLFSVDLEEKLLVWDLRPGRRALLTLLAGADRLLYHACDRACELSRLSEALERSPERPMTRGAIVERLEPLVRAGLLLRDGTRYLALAVPLGDAYCLSAPAQHRLQALARSIGRRVDGGWVVVAGEAPRRAERRPTPVPRRRRRGRRRRAPRLSAVHFSIVGPGDVLIRCRPLRAHAEERRS